MSVSFCFERSTQVLEVLCKQHVDCRTYRYIPSSLSSTWRFPASYFLGAGAERVAPGLPPGLSVSVPLPPFSGQLLRMIRTGGNDLWQPAIVGAWEDFESF